MREEMKCGGSLPDGSHGCMFHATVSAARPASDYTTASDTSEVRSGDSFGIRSDPMATIAKPPQRELRDYIAEISERTDVRAGSPLPLGTQQTGRGRQFRHFQPSRQPRSAGVVRPPRRSQRPRGSLILIELATTPATYGTFGWRDWPRPSLCVPRGWALRTQRRTSVQLQQASPRSLCCRDFATASVGFCVRTWIRPVSARARLGHFEAGQLSIDAEIRLCQ